MTNNDALYEFVNELFPNEVIIFMLLLNTINTILTLEISRDCTKLYHRIWKTFIESHMEESVPSYIREQHDYFKLLRL